MNVMILAAGEGVRLKPHTLRLAKPAMPFLNVPLMSYVLEFLNSEQNSKIVMNTYHLPETVQRAALYCQKQMNLKEIIFSHESQELLGSGGGLKYAEKHFAQDESLVLANADEVILAQDSFQIGSVIEFNKQSGALATLLVCRHPLLGVKFNSVKVDQTGNLQAIVKIPFQPTKQDYHYLGIAILNKRIFSLIPRGTSQIFTDVLIPAIKTGEKCNIYEIQCETLETGNPADFLEANKFCLKKLEQGSSTFLNRISKKFPERMSMFPNEQGITLGNYTDFQSAIANGLTFEGYNTIGSKVNIRSPIKIINSIVGDHVTLGNSDLNNKLMI